MGREAENRIARAQAISIAELHSPLRSLNRVSFLFPRQDIARRQKLSPARSFILPWERIARILEEVGIGREKLVETRRSRPIPRRRFSLMPTFADISLSSTS